MSVSVQAHVLAADPPGGELLMDGMLQSQLHAAELTSGNNLWLIPPSKHCPFGPSLCVTENRLTFFLWDLFCTASGGGCSTAWVTFMELHCKIIR